MMIDNSDDDVYAIPLDQRHLIALACGIVACVLGGGLLCLTTDIAVSFWQAFTLVAFLVLGFVCLYRGCRRLSGHTPVQRWRYWHQNRDIINALMWLSVTGALLIVWIFSTIWPPSLSALLLAGFCLGACFSLARFIILVIPSLPLSF